MWKCSVCGYVHDGDGAPDKCVKCGAAPDKFEALGDDARQLIERSRFSNRLLAVLIDLGSQLEDLAEEGIDDNLDPGCVGIYQYAQKVGREIKQMAKAEIQTHVSKGKWG